MVTRPTVKPLRPLYGVTITDIETIDDAIQKIQQLQVPITARVVIDDERSTKDYIEPIYKLSHSASIMIQVSDSYVEKVKPLHFVDYISKCAWLLDEFIGIAEYFEIGNEINGDWLTREITAKVDACSKMCENRKMKRAITFFNDDTLRIWLTQHVHIRAELSLLSCYPNSLEDMTDLKISLPESLIAISDWCQATQRGIGEYGDEEWQGNNYGVKANLIHFFSHYPGGFIWDFQNLNESQLALLKEGWR